MNNPFELLSAKLTVIEGLLLDIKHTQSIIPADNKETDDTLTIERASKLLSLAKATVYSLVSRNEIPYSKKGKRLYFSRQELLDWIKSGRNKTNDEISAQAEGYVVKNRRW